MSTMHFSVHVKDLTKGEVMDSLRRLMVKPYLILWAIVYAVVLVVGLVKGSFNAFTICCPAIILILLALAYEFSGHKNFGKMGYDKAELFYDITPRGYKLTVGEKSAEFTWQAVRTVKTRKNFLLYSDKNNCSVLPLRCLTQEQKDLIDSWSK